MSAKLEDRVAEGVEFLNDHGPAGWWEDVDLDLLQMDDPEMCVLGQVYAAAAHESGIRTGYQYTQSFFTEFGGLATFSSDAWDGWCNWTERCGFAIRYLAGETPEEANAAWQAAITNLREEIFA